jgi:glycosyltransferase involved in cell wall biosynthesis
VVVTEHYTGFGRGLVTGADRWVARVAFSRADLVAPVSEELAGHLRAIAPRARIQVLPNVVDTEVFKATPHDPHDGPTRLLTVGSLAEKKGHVFLLDALARLRARREAELDVVGDGELRTLLNARAAELGLGSSVRFHGELPKHEVARLMAQADVFVLPSLHETFGCVLIEAMASGLPSVATHVGGVPEVLPSAAGDLVRAGDAEALAEAIETSLEREFEPAELHGLAERSYGYAAVAGRWSAVYGELLSSRGRTSSATRCRSSSSR